MKNIWASRNGHHSILTYGHMNSFQANTLFSWNPKKFNLMSRLLRDFVNWFYPMKKLYRNKCIRKFFSSNGLPYTIDEIMKRDIFNVLFCFYSTLFSWSFFFSPNIRFDLFCSDLHIDFFCTHKNLIELLL